MTKAHTKAPAPDFHPGFRPDFRPDFRHVRDWIFDLDNTLYPADCGLFARIDERMTNFIMENLLIQFHHKCPPIGYPAIRVIQHV